MNQITNTILMVKPLHFGYNPETAINNAFQKSSSEDETTIAQKATEEFDNAVQILNSHGIHILVVKDTDEPKKPDAIFPNNWITTHEDGVILSYPMFSPIRRNERRSDIIQMLTERYQVEKDYTFEHYEEEDLFLEGTGSLILDRKHKIVYACLSPRTDISLLNKWCVLMEYQKMTFHAHDSSGKEIYHTNVIMALGEQEAILCTESITNEDERKQVVSLLEKTGKTVIEISLDQVSKFAGNMIELKNGAQKYWVMSESAKKSLSQEQIQQLEKNNKILSIPIPTIEYYGGGSIRCMIAEIFLKRK